MQFSEFERKNVKESDWMVDGSDWIYLGFVWWIGREADGEGLGRARGFWKSMKGDRNFGEARRNIGIKLDRFGGHLKVSVASWAFCGRGLSKQPITLTFHHPNPALLPPHHPIKPQNSTAKINLQASEVRNLKIPPLHRPIFFCKQFIF
jgi:hypothetical protein